MSAFIVKDKTINRILSFFYWNKDDMLKHTIDFKLKELGISLRELTKDEDIDAELSRLGKAMFRLNYASVNQRYERKDKPEPYKFKDVKTEIIQALKSLNCFLYQSCEGNCEEENIYKVLREIETAITKNIVYNLEEYNSADWD